jgi:hypothetical protein
MSNRSRGELLRYYALSYAQAGLRVMPCHYVLTDNTCSCGQLDCGKNIGKHPMTRHGVKDATWNLDQIDRWWDATPLANIALVPDFLRDVDVEWMALDLDTGTRKRGNSLVQLDGFGDLDALERKYREDVPRQIIQRTGSGGEHILMLKGPGKLPGALGPAIDVISGSGRYILAAPSNHVSGYNYEWKNDKIGRGPLIERLGRVLPAIGYAPQWVMEYDPHSDKVAKRREQDADDDRRHGDELRAIRRRQGTDLTKDEFAEALDLVPNNDVPYDEYLAMLFAIHHEGAAKDDFEWAYQLASRWAQKSDKYRQSDFDHRWESIRDEGHTKTGKYVLMLAGQAGWVVPQQGPIGDAVRELNKKHAMVLNSGKGMVVTVDKNRRGEEILSFSDTAKLAPWYANKRVAVPDPTPADPHRIKMVPKDKLWLVSENRREYGSMVFDPQGSEPGVLNLWQGFAYKPSKHRDPYRHCNLWVDHIYDVICSGNEDDGDWVVGYFAHLIQRPEEKLGTALVMIGEMGTGKSIVGMHVGRLMPRHTSIVDKAEQIVGKFNMHLARCLLLLAEEAFWAGDKSAEGSLKHLVTSDTLTIEPKGVDPYTIDNFTRLVVTTNHAWAVPAGMDERRFATFRVSNHRKRDLRYFKAMADQLENGGYEALLQYLMEFDLSRVNLRTIPQTEALLDQKIATADPHVKWLLEMLTAGTPWWGLDGSHKGEAETDVFYESYLSYCRDNRVNRHLDIRMFGREMKRLLYGFEKFRPRTDDGARRHRYSFGYLNQCRESFETALNQRVFTREDR